MMMVQVFTLFHFGKKNHLLAKVIMNAPILLKAGFVLMIYKEVHLKHLKQTA